MSSTVQFGTGIINSQPEVQAVSQSIDKSTTTALLGTIAAFTAYNTNTVAASTVGYAISPNDQGINQLVVGAYALTPYQLESAGILKPGSSNLVASQIAGGADIRTAMPTQFFTGKLGVTDVDSLILNQNAQASVAVTNLQQSQTQLTNSGLITGKEDSSQIAGAVLAGSLVGVPQTITLVKGLNSIQPVAQSTVPTVTGIAAGGFGPSSPSFYANVYIGDPSSPASLGTSVNNAVVNIGTSLSKGVGGMLVGSVSGSINNAFTSVLGKNVGGVVGKAVTGALTNVVSSGVNSLVQSGLSSLGFNVAQNAAGAGISGVTGAIGGGLGGIATAGINNLTGGALTSLTQSVSGSLTSAFGSQVGGALGNAFSGAVSSVAGAALGAGLQALGVGNIIGGLFGGGGPNLSGLKTALGGLSTVPSYAQLNSSQRGTAATVFTAIASSMPKLQVGVPVNLTAVLVNVAKTTLVASVAKSPSSASSIASSIASSTLRQAGNAVVSALGQSAGKAVGTSIQGALNSVTTSITNALKPDYSNTANAIPIQQSTGNLTDDLCHNTFAASSTTLLVGEGELTPLAQNIASGQNAAEIAAGALILPGGIGSTASTVDLSDTTNSNLPGSTSIAVQAQNASSGNNGLQEIELSPNAQYQVDTTPSGADAFNPDAWNDNTQATDEEIAQSQLNSEIASVAVAPDQITSSPLQSLVNSLTNSGAAQMFAGSSSVSGGNGGSTATGGIITPTVATNTIVRTAVNAAVLRILNGVATPPTLLGGTFTTPNLKTAASIATAQTAAQTSSNNLIALNSQVTNAYNNLQYAQNNYPQGDPRIIQAQQTYTALKQTTAG